MTTKTNETKTNAKPLSQTALKAEYKRLTTIKIAALAKKDRKLAKKTRRQMRKIKAQLTTAPTAPAKTVKRNKAAAAPATVAPAAIAIETEMAAAIA